MTLLKKFLLTIAALIVSSPALEARPRLFNRGKCCGASQPAMTPAAQHRPVLQAVSNLGQAVVAVPQALVVRATAPVMPVSFGGCPGGVCPIR